MHISDTAEVHSSANTTISAIALVAQWIERRFPEPQVACSIHAEGTGSCRGHWVMPRALGHAEGTGSTCLSYVTFPLYNPKPRDA
jgi:hypothetical protein